MKNLNNNSPKPLTELSAREINQYHALLRFLLFNEKNNALKTLDSDLLDERVLNSTDHEGWSAMHYAAFYLTEGEPVIRKLALKGSHLESTVSHKSLYLERQTPLWMAIQHGHDSNVKTLIEIGASMGDILCESDPHNALSFAKQLEAEGIGNREVTQIIEGVCLAIREKHALEKVVSNIQHKGQATSSPFHFKKAKKSKTL